MEITTKLKRMLLSQDLISQDKCIRFMIHVLRDPKKFDYISTKFLDDDLIQFLCEPLLSIKTSLLQNICLCIWMLSKNQKFYERNDVLYTCNSLMRTLVFLLKTKNPVATNLIQLLAIFLKKGGKKLREACNLSQVLTVVKMILANSASLPDRCTINSVSILTTILSCPLVELNGKLYSTTISVSKTICKIIAEKKIIEPHIVGIASDISSSILRFYSTIMKRIQLNANLTQHRNVIDPLKSVAWYMIKNVSLPFVQKNLNSNIYRKTYYKGLKCLISPFDVTLPPHILHNVANQYATQGMIKVSYELLESSDLGALAEQLLLNIIYRLAIANLEVELYWPGGLEMFYNQLVEGFRRFPKTPKDVCAT
ncbi:uncharacterized protein LOC126843009 [Adelges cooleyi]|uniref:uncharacterized protein LOC126843009 n=1 Tax=Adelges cooleyi TaxID=133065 RepID=UPI00217FC8A3|nr:uncharacterized protein LOC126843009 [Adelges cooleyi]